MGIVAGAALALGAIVAQANRPTLGPSASLWLWVAPGLVEVVAPGDDDRDLILCGLSTDLRKQGVEVRVLDGSGHELGRRSWELPTAMPSELPLEPMFPEGAASPHTERFTLVVGGLDLAPSWLAISLRSQSGACGVDHPPGTWLQADPTVARQLLGPGRSGGS
jgi:hypothetical protein